MTKSPKYLFWALEFDTNVLMDPFFVETVNYWSILLNSNECDDKASLKSLLGNVGAVSYTHLTLPTMFEV